MKDFSVRVLRSLTIIVAAGAFSLTGTSAASAASEVDYCRTHYEAAGFNNPGECIRLVFAGR